MIKKLIGLTLMLLLSFVVFADDDDDKKKAKRSGNEVRQMDLDSIDSDDIHKLQEHTEDTLVFEDWDGSDITDKKEILTAPLGNQFGDEDENSGDTDLDLLGKSGVECTTHILECNISLYPNPAVNELHITVNVQPNEIRVVSLTGETHIQTPASDVVDVSGLEVGIYFVQLVYDNTIETKKFVKK